VAETKEVCLLQDLEDEVEKEGEAGKDLKQFTSILMNEKKEVLIDDLAVKKRQKARVIIEVKRLGRIPRTTSRYTGELLRMDQYNSLECHDLDDLEVSVGDEQDEGENNGP